MQAQILSKVTSVGTRQGLLKYPQASSSEEPCSKTVRITDNVKLCYQEYGSATGFPVFYFHSIGSSRLECRFFNRSARKKGFRLIAVDRPGIGGSDFRQQFTTSEFATQLIALADILGIKRFGIMSFATGGVFALATAYHYPDRVVFQLSLGGIPVNSPCRAAGQHSFISSCMNSFLPVLVRFITHMRHALGTSDPSEDIQRLQDTLCYTDRKALNDPVLFGILKSSSIESLRQGIQGVAQDTGLCFREPGFVIAEIFVPILIWQGAADNIHSPTASAYLANRIPGARFHQVANRGYFFFIHYMDEIFNRVKGLSKELKLAA